MKVLLETLEACFSPVGLVTLLLVSGFLVSSFRRGAPQGPRLISVGAALYLLFVLTPLAEALYASLEHSEPPMLHADSSARAIVVLSAYGEAVPVIPVTSELTGESISRLVEGIRLYRELSGAKLVLSGGILRKQDAPISTLMADFARAMGVPDQDIVQENSATSTYENMVETKKIVGAEPFILVTSSGELWRATAVARKLGMRPLPAPAGIWAAHRYPASMTWWEWGWKLASDTGSPKTHRLGYLQRAYHEYLAYLWYRVLGRV